LSPVVDAGIEAPQSRAIGPAGQPIPIAATFDPKALTPVLFLPRSAAGAARLELEGGPYSRASVENIASGARRDFDLTGAKTLVLDLAHGPLAATLQPGRDSLGQTGNMR